MHPCLIPEEYQDAIRVDEPNSLGIKDPTKTYHFYGAGYLCLVQSCGQM